MISTLKTSKSRLVVTAIPIIFLIAYLGIAVLYLNDYFIYGPFIFLGLIVAPYVLKIRKEDHSSRMLIPALALIILSFLIPVKSLLFLSLLFGLFYFLESNFGRINYSFIFLILLISPVFNYLSNSIGLPLRLWLSDLAGVIFQFVGYDAQISGNYILLEGSEFSVDTACAGLKMMTISFLMALFIIAHQERKRNITLSFYFVVGMLFITLFFNIVSNLFRILLLVRFKILPEDPMHEVVGILCLIIYVGIPFLALSNYLFSKIKFKSKLGKQKRRRFYLPLNITLLAGILAIGINIGSYSPDHHPNENYAIDGFEKKILENGILKFENEKALIYVKNMSPYAAEHNPMICWTGSGYVFNHVKKEVINDLEIYTGTIKKGDDIIYTAWWFDGGVHKTIDLLDWRWKALKGEGSYSLINVNASTKQKLINVTKNLL